jgi:hypothetical protein
MAGLAITGFRQICAALDFLKICHGVSARKLQQRYDPEHRRGRIDTEEFI